MLLHLTLPQIAYINTLRIAMIMLMLVTVDTISSWTIIVNRYNKTHNHECNLWNTFRGICFRAWEVGYLESQQFRVRLGKKVEGYTLAILTALIFYLFPHYSYNGIEIHTTIPMFIYLSIVLAEGFSIAENLKLMGVENLGLVENALKTILGRLGIKEDDKDGNK